MLWLRLCTPLHVHDKEMRCSLCNSMPILFFFFDLCSLSEPVTPFYFSVSLKENNH